MHASRRNLLGLGAAFGFVSASLIAACGQVPLVTMTDRKVPAGIALPADGAPAPTDAEDPVALGKALDALAGQRLILVGESHDRLDHHLNQLAVIRGLHERGVPVAVGMEFFQEPFQSHLDAYVAGEIDERRLLRETEYYERWRYDFRLYRDILSYAREHRLPLVALNAPAELSRRVSRVGIAGLDSDERSLMPSDLATPDAAYLERLRPVFEMHGHASPEGLQRFAEAQMLWDEHMARVARDYVTANPDRTLVILAGDGHVAYPDAIPGRLGRMLGEEPAVVVSGSPERYTEGRFDVLLAERDIELTPPGSTGMRLAKGKAGVTVDQVGTSTPAARAGLRPGDRIVSIGGEPVADIPDLRLALLDRAPGERVRIEVERGEGPESGRRLARVLRLL